MAIIKNKIIINAPIEKIWFELATLDRLGLYDPGAKISNVLTQNHSGIGAKRRVDMEDGKNWFEEECTVFVENQDLKFELTACSFPVHSLNHRYTFKKLNENSYEIGQIQSYKMKYGFLGKIMGEALKPKWNKGVQSFLKGLKDISEKKN